MSANEKIVDIELRFRPNASAAFWEDLFEDLTAWNPQLVPDRVDRLSDLDGDEEEVWTPGHLTELAHRCAARQRFGWDLLNAAYNESGITVSGKADEVQLSLALADPSPDPVEMFRDLLTRLPAVARPALGMIFDRYSEEAECVSQGLTGLSDLPPILYLDEKCVSQLGGGPFFEKAPCKTMSASTGGILLKLRQNIWKPPTSKEKQALRAVKRYLGITAEKPLVLH